MSTVRAAFADQGRSCRMLGSELTAQVVEALGTTLDPDQGRVACTVLAWPGDATSRGDSVPLRLAGALHGLVLDGLAPDLAAAYAQGNAPAAQLLHTIATHEERILDWLKSAPQTNEVARSAVLIAGACFAMARLENPLPLALLELGASAGLNLNFPDYSLEVEGASLGSPDTVLRLTPDWSGPLPDPVPLRSLSRQGVDLAPPDRAAPTRMRAYIWADQPARLARMDAALAHAATHPPEVAQGDAADWLDHAVLHRAGALTFVYHTVAFQYFPPAVQARILHRLEAAGRVATVQAPLAHLSMEADDTHGSAALTLRIWDGRARGWQLGRADFHGRWIDWQPRDL